VRRDCGSARACGLRRRIRLEHHRGAAADGADHRRGYPAGRHYQHEADLDAELDGLELKLGGDW
jgi:hypothetical protein